MVGGAKADNSDALIACCAGVCLVPPKLVVPPPVACGPTPNNGHGRERLVRARPTITSETVTIHCLTTTSNGFASERVRLTPAEFNRMTKCLHKTTGVFRIINLEERFPSFTLLFGFMVVPVQFGIDNIPILVDERCLDVRKEDYLRVIATYFRFVTSGVAKVSVQMRFD